MDIQKKSNSQKIIFLRRFEKKVFYFCPILDFGKDFYSKSYKSWKKISISISIQKIAFFPFLILTARLRQPNRFKSGVKVKMGQNLGFFVLFAEKTKNSDPISEILCVVGRNLNQIPESKFILMFR